MSEGVVERTTTQGNPSFVQALEKAAAVKERACTVVLICACRGGDIQAALASPGVRSLVVPGPMAYGSERVGEIWPDRNTWRLPALCARVIVLAARRDRFGLPMLMQAARRGVLRIHWWSPFGWESASVWWLLVQQTKLRIGDRIATQWLGAGGRRPSGKGKSEPGFTSTPSRARCVLEDVTFGRGPRRLFCRGGEGLLPASAFNSRRVLLVNGTLGPGGAERQCVNTLFGLKTNGVHDVGIACRFIGSRPLADFYRRALDDAGIDSVELPPADFHACGLDAVALRRLRTDLGAVPHQLRDQCADLVAELLRRKPGIVHAWQDEPSLVAALAAVIVGVPRVILSARSIAAVNFAYHAPFMRAAYRAAAAGGRVLLTNNSQAGAEDYERWLGLAPTRITVMRNGVDVATLETAGRNGDAAGLRRSLGIPEDSPVIGGVFRLSTEKRPLLWAETAAAVLARIPDAHFLLVGDGEQRVELEAHVEALGIAERLHLPGVLMQVGDALAAMQVFLLTSAFEGTPNVMLEAQWMGVPVVATRAGGCGETFVPGETGWLVTDAQPDVLAARVCEALGDTAWRAGVRKKARAFIREQYGMNAMISRTLKAYGISPR